MNLFTQIIIMAFLVEAIWETLKLLWQEGKANTNSIGALVVGILIAFTLQVDIFVAIGLEPVIGTIGVVCTGILISRGGNYIHDFIDKLGGGNND